MDDDNFSSPYLSSKISNLLLVKSLIGLSDSKSLFYSIETGLKLKELQTQEVEGNSIITENFYSNYEDVDGILFPMSINLVTPSIPIPGGLNLSAKSIKLNVDVSDSDFE